MKLKSIRPYLLRAFYEWIVDNQLTPHVVVDATIKDVVVPRQYVENGKIVLNIAPTAVRGLKIDNDHMEFSARFGGSPYHLNVPVLAVEAIYSRENGKGMVFPQESEEHSPEDPGGPPAGVASKKPALKVVK